MRRTRCALATDFDADDSLDDIELLNIDANASHARVFQQYRCDPLSESLNEIYMAAADDQTNRVENDVIREDRAHIVRVRASPSHQRFDLEHHALLTLALEIISADLRGNDKIAHEHPVYLTVGVPSADNTSRKQPPINFWRGVRFGPFTRDQITDERNRLRVDRAVAVVGMAKGAAESEDVGAHEQQAGDVGSLKRTRKAAREFPPRGTASRNPRAL